MANYIKKRFTFEGKKYYVYGKSEQEAIEKMVRRKIELEEGRNRITKNTLCKDWFNTWLETYKMPSVSPGWYANMKSIVDSTIIAEIGNLPLKSVKPIHLQRILNGKAGLSNSYLRTIYIIITDAFKTARKNGLINADPAEAVVIPKGKPAESRRALTAKERKYILITCEHHRAGLYYKLMLFCGLRPGEAAALQWRNVDTENRIISIDSAVKSDGSIGRPKSAAGIRKVPIPASLLPDLVKAKGRSPFGFVCTNAHGGQLKPSSIRQQWKSFLHQLNIEMGCRTFRGALVPPYPVAEDLVPYCLRHTYCTDLQAAGVPINVARELMGHSDIAVTSKIYTHSSAESFSDAELALNKLAERRNKKNEVISKVDDL